MEQCQFDMQKADEESRIIKDENESIKNSIGKRISFVEHISYFLNSKHKNTKI